MVREVEFEESWEMRDAAWGSYIRVCVVDSSGHIGFLP